MNELTTSRRLFLQASGAGAFVLAFPVLAEGTRRGGEGYRTAYLKITPDDEVIVISPLAEIGQGTSTALSMVIGDTLDADWGRILVELASVDPAYNSPILFQQLTGASTGTSGFNGIFRKAGATARTMLLQAAARRWNVPVEQVQTQAGRIIGPRLGMDVRYGELASTISLMPVPEKIIERTDARPRFEGARITRIDLPSKVDGSAQYAVDLRLPGMLYAAVAAAPVFGGKLKSDQRAEVLKRKGVRGIVDLPNGVAVVAERWWTARTALDALQPEWAETPHDSVNDASIMAQFERDFAAQPGVVVEQRGSPEQMMGKAHKVITGRYQVPFLAHATMEPMSCVARVERGRGEIWLGSQHPANARAAAAKVLGVPDDRVTYHPLIAGGGFGRRQETDMVQQAMMAAKQFSPRPVKLIWTREEDVSHDFYRPAGISEIKVGITGSEIVAYSHRQVTPSILARMYPVAMKEFDSVVTDAVVPPYEFQHVDARWVRSETHVPAGMWRSVGASQTVFAIESFIDEIAAEIGIDELALRRKLLAKTPRALAALDKLVEISGWPGPTSSGSAIGIGLSHKWQDCLVAQSAQVAIRDGRLIVERICTVADPGRAVNRDAVIAQMEGAAIWGLSSALFGQITIANGCVSESNFHDYRVVRLSETPILDTVIIEGGDPIEGTGEGGSPNVAPAICNAIYKLTGKRIRRLPIMTQFMEQEDR
ncbi:xanthine dehydrogenase family protein molybdopterin-binding subunit [Sphingomonas xinjiangensis]|uniref:CO/xanthine dehydrogenase Mo-binding subunit n=1 Tax=Sphingomonas xinjiangensis TaxID=643568 RepID=A0A840YIE7_9SPHN|nr:molybdopterin cofactor-binding domain-containing protein [Sphingomonas xinjiangensis]MBB5711849.1 CO/xanthine dehydrogenase Mo-binding subunit [Sphingomonas xinjiangensis]